MNQEWLRSLVWMDYRLAVLFTVIFPLVLFIWAFVKQEEAITRLMMIYWRVASLLAIALYLMIAAIPISFIVSFAGHLLVPLSLWFWVDLNEEINDLPASRPLKLSFNSWRWAITFYLLLGAVSLLPFLRCAFLSKVNLLADAACTVWLEAPWLYKETLHRNLTEGFVGFIGILGLLIYILYFSYFVLIRLGKQGRSAIG